jgi:hypothetical protein
MVGGRDTPVLLPPVLLAPPLELPRELEPAEVAEASAALELEAPVDEPDALPALEAVLEAVLEPVPLPLSSWWPRVAVPVQAASTLIKNATERNLTCRHPLLGLR